MSRHSNPMESCLLANENPRLTKMFSNNSHFLMHSSIKFIGPCVNASKRRFELSRRGLSYIVLTHLMPELCLLGNKLYLSQKSKTFAYFVHKVNYTHKMLKSWTLRLTGFQTQVHRGYQNTSKASQSVFKNKTIYTLEISKCSY